MTTRISVAAIVFASSVIFSTSASAVLIDDFNDGNDTGWTRFDSTVGSSYGPGTFDASSLSYHLQGSGPVPTGQIGNIASFWNESAAPQFQDGFLRGKIKVETNTVAYLILRGNTTTGNFYLFGIDPSNDPPAFFFNRIQGGSTVARFAGFDVPGESVDFGEEWIIEAGAIGSQLSMKAWKPGSPEPALPQWSGVDTVIANGRFGLGANHFSPQPPSIVSATFDDIFFRPVPEPATALLAIVAIVRLLMTRCGRDNSPPRLNPVGEPRGLTMEKRDL